MKKNNIVGLVIICGFSVCILLKSAWENVKLNDSQVFVIGKLYERHHGGNIANGAYYHYYLHGIKYNFSYATRGDVDSLIFLKVAPDDPNVKRKIDEKVPNCLSIDEVPREGWRELPLNLCE